ncbi:MAG: ABC transporter permease [Clostridiales bacterium]|jgi:putative ABC transport system permease protein|nr:MAG: ABC transporter permease [Clostridiales bacterium]
MGSFITLGTIQTALELGVIYSLVALALFLSFSMLNVCDLSTDSCFTLGCAVGSMVAIAGHPILAIFAAMGAGILSGYLTALLQTKLGVESILAGIIVNTGLYTINIFIMGKSILNLNTTTTVFTLARDLLKGSPLEDWSRLIVAVLFVGVIAVLLAFFLHTRLGLSIRATGDNEDMVKASSINPSLTIIVGLCVANAMTALSGCLLGEYQKSCDINMGTGMVTIALASLIIGETLMGRGGIPFRIVGVLFGSCLYRVIVAIAMRFNLPASALKLVSALIVAVAIASPTLRQMVGFQKIKWRRKSQYGQQKAAANQGKDGEGPC